MTIKLTEQSAIRYNTMADETEEAFNAVLAVQRRISGIEHQMRNANASPISDEGKAFAEELDRQRSRLTAAQTTLDDLSRVHTAVKTWLTSLPRTAVIEDAEPELVTLKSGETYADGVLRMRADIEELVGTRNATRAALLPTDELQAQVIAHVDGLAARGAPRLRIEGERLAIKHDASGGHTASAQEMLAWLHGADMKKHLFDMIEKQRERELRHGALVMSTQERKSRIALLDGQILDKEREEEQVIRDAEEEGTIIRRRETCDPRAILGVRIAPRVKDGVAQGQVLEVSASVIPGSATADNNQSSPLSHPL